MLVTVRPMVLRSRPVLEAMMPLPTPEMTPDYESVSTHCFSTSRDKNFMTGVELTS